MKIMKSLSILAVGLLVASAASAVSIQVSRDQIDAALNVDRVGASYPAGSTGNIRVTGSEPLIVKSADSRLKSVSLNNETVDIDFGTTALAEYEGKTVATIYKDKQEVAVIVMQGSNAIVKGVCWHDGKPHWC